MSKQKKQPDQSAQKQLQELLDGLTGADEYAAAKRILTGFLGGEPPIEVRWAADAPGATVPPIYAVLEKLAEDLRAEGVTVKTLNQFFDRYLLDRQNQSDR